jgi:integrase
MRRVSALLELTWDQIDERVGRIRLNPEGRRQNNKRRATVPITPTLAAKLATWERDNERVITQLRQAARHPEFFDLLAETAGVTGGPNVIRLHKGSASGTLRPTCSWATRAKEVPRERLASTVGPSTWRA